jgi:hypothetical protein
MERSLFFSLPFLAMWLFSGITLKQSYIASGLSVLILIFGSWSLIQDREHYFVTQESGYAGTIAEAHQLKIQTEQSASMISILPQVYEREAAKLQLNTDGIEILTEEHAQEKWIGLMASGEYEAVGLGRTMQFFYPSPAYDALAIMNNFYPEKQVNWFNSDFRTFKNGASATQVVREISFPEDSLWSTNPSYFENGSYTIPGTQEWGFSAEFNLAEITRHPNNELAVCLEIESDSIPEGFELISVMSKGDEQLHYTFTSANTETYPYIALGFKLSDFSIDPESTQWKVFTWNKSGQEVSICRAKLLVLKGNPLQYAWYQKIIPNE